MGCSSGPDVVEDGLVLCLDAGSKRSYPKSGTTWSDLVGANDGTLTNMDASNFSDDNGGSFSFDGTNEYVDFGSDCVSSIRGSSYLTMSAWVKKTSSGSDCNLGAWYFGGTYGFFMQWFSDGNFYAGASNGGNKGNYTSVSWSDNWFNLGFVFDGTQSTASQKGKLFVNGNLKPQGGTFGGGVSDSIVSTNTADFYVGALQNYGSKTNGLISSVNVYDRALTADEIRRNYLSTKERYQ